MSIKHEVTSGSAINWNKVFKMGVIPKNVNEAIKKALCKEKENIEDIEDAVCIIVIDKKNRQSILTSGRTKAMAFVDSGSEESSTCYRWEEDACLWLATCARTSGGQLTASFKECCSEIPPCSEDPEKRVVDLEGPCPCEEE